MRTTPRSGQLRERFLQRFGSRLLVAELRRPGVDLVLVNVDRRENVVLHEALGEHDRVLEVVALERHEGDEQVCAERKLAVVGRAAVCQHLAREHSVAQAHHRLVVDERSLVRAHELRQRVGVLAVLRLDDDLVGVDVATRRALSASDVARIDRGAIFEAGTTRGAAGRAAEQPPLHVRAHERSVRVAVLEERISAVEDRDDLRRGDVRELDVLRRGDTASPSAERPTPRPRGASFLSSVAVACAIVARLDGVEVDDLAGHLPPITLQYGVWMKPNPTRSRRGEIADQADASGLPASRSAHAAVVRRCTSRTSIGALASGRPLRAR
jgi:hypothetical protein